MSELPYCIPNNLHNCMKNEDYFKKTIFNKVFKLMCLTNIMENARILRIVVCFGIFELHTIKKKPVHLFCAVNKITIEFHSTLLNF